MATYSDVARTLAEHLPGDWRATTSDNDKLGASVTRADGLRLFVGADWSDYAHRAEIRYGSPAYRHGDAAHRVTVSRHRDPVALARDVARRLLTPELDAHYVRDAARARESEELAARRDAVADRLAAHALTSESFRLTRPLRGPDWRPRGPLDLPGDYATGSWEVSPGGFVSVALSGLPADAVLAVLDALAGCEL